MADAKVTALSALTAITGDDLLYVVDDPAGTPASKKATAAVLRDFTNMVQAALADANTTMAVNTLYVGTMAAWATADRTYTLPTTAAVGDRIGIMITGGNATYELIITAGTSDTLNGVAGGTEWSRLFITGEVVILRCVTANSAWVVEYDGRIACMAGMLKASTTSVDTVSVTKILLDASILDTAGGFVNTTNNRLDIRRAGTYQATGKAAAEGAAITSHQTRIHKNGTFLFNQSQDVGIANSVAPSFGLVTLAVGDYLELFYYHGTGSAKTYWGATGDDSTSIYIQERL